MTGVGTNFVGTKILTLLSYGRTIQLANFFCYFVIIVLFSAEGKIFMAQLEKNNCSYMKTIAEINLLQDQKIVLQI